MPRNGGKNTTLLASMTLRGIGPCMAVEGATTKVVFKAYVERVLAADPTIGPARGDGQPSAHKGKRAKELVEGQGSELLSLPPYSPAQHHRTSVREAEGLVAKGGSQAREALIEAMGRALDAIFASDASGFFCHCGYRTPVQLP